MVARKPAAKKAVAKPEPEETDGSRGRTSDLGKYELFAEWAAEERDFEVDPEQAQFTVLNYKHFQASDMNKEYNEAKRAEVAERNAEREQRAAERATKKAEKDAAPAKKTTAKKTAATESAPKVTARKTAAKKTTPAKKTAARKTTAAKRAASADADY